MYVEHVVHVHKYVAGSLSVSFARVHSNAFAGHGRIDGALLRIRVRVIVAPRMRQSL